MVVLHAFLEAMFFSAQAQMLLSEIEISLKLALAYLTKRCLKCLLGRVQSFGNRSQYFPRFVFQNAQFQASVAYKSVV